MRYLKSFEGIVPVRPGTNKEYRIQNLQHKGEPIESGDNISILQQDWFEKLLPDSLYIVSDPKLSKLNFDQSLTPIEKKEYIFDKNDCTIDNGLVQFNYWYDPRLHPGAELEDGEPSCIEFDIHFSKNERGFKLIVDITYGDHKVTEFSIEAPNKINIVHYTGAGSKYDDSTHWGFKDESINDLVKFFNAFNHGIQLEPKDLSFIDEHFDSYEHEEHNQDHLYTDDSDLIEFGNSMKESTDSDIFLIINNTKPPGNKYLPKVIKYLTNRNLNFRIASTPEEVERYNSEYNIIGAFSTGSDYSMTSPDSPSEYSTNEKALEILSCPIIAMCYGFQSMAKFYGQEITGGDLNCDQFLLTDYDDSHFLFRGIDLSTQKVSFCFHDYPSNVPQGFEVIAMLGDIISGISNESENRYGLLFHPEELESTYVILDNFVNSCEVNKGSEMKYLQTFEKFNK